MMLTRRAIEERCSGFFESLGPLRVVLDDGPKRGHRLVLLRSGAGLEVAVDLDAGMDLWRASFLGRPVDLALPTHGNSHATWLRRWSGGLLTTCGLRNVGPAGNVDGELVGQHGEAAQLAAADVEASAHWEGDQHVVRVAGSLREHSLIAENLSRRRTWTLTTGENQLHLVDVIRNEGFRPEHVLLLHHINLGWPLLDDDTTVEVGGTTTKFGPPVTTRGEVVTSARSAPEGDGRCRARVAGSGMQLTVSWSADELPWFTQWLMPQAGVYALGLEPGTCTTEGRLSEIEAGRGLRLEPGQEARIALQLSFDTSPS